MDGNQGGEQGTLPAASTHLGSYTGFLSLHRIRDKPQHHHMAIPFNLSELFRNDNAHFFLCQHGFDFLLSFCK